MAHYLAEYRFVRTTRNFAVFAHVVGVKPYQCAALRRSTWPYYYIHKNAYAEMGYPTYVYVSIDTTLPPT